MNKVRVAPVQPTSSKVDGSAELAKGITIIKPL